VKQYSQGPTTSITVHKNAQFKMRINKSHKPLVHAGNQNVGVKGERVKPGVVAASRKDSNVPARALATVIARRIPTTVNEFSMLLMILILVRNTQ
jgi:hypothetical protein